MLTQFIRVLKKSNAEDIIDLSMANAERESFKPDKQFLYLAQRYPFNNFIIKLKTVNSVTTSKIKIEYWNGQAWKEAVDVLDFTKGMTKTGVVQFSLNETDNWCEIEKTDAQAGQAPEELRGLNISDCHWLKISWSDALHADTEIECISYAFTTTAKVNGVDIEAKNYFETFKAGKTDWLEEIITASEMMVSELKSSQLIKAPGQIILLDDFYLPCAYRTLAHIYLNMGKAYNDKKADVVAAYQNFLGGVMSVDKNMDARQEKTEDATTQTRLVR